MYIKRDLRIFYLNVSPSALADVAQWTCKPKGCWFHSQSGHTPALQARSPVGGALEATIHWCFPLPPFSTSPLSENKKNLFKNWMLLFLWRKGPMKGKVPRAHQSHNVALQSGSDILWAWAFRTVVGKEDCSRWLDLATWGLERLQLLYSLWAKLRDTLRKQNKDHRKIQSTEPSCFYV